MRYLVLGANGQTASYLIERLLEDEHTVIGVSRTINPHGDKRVLNLILDLRNIQKLQGLLQDTQPDVVVNLASKSSVVACEIDPEDSNQINYLMVLRLIDEIIRYNNEFRKDIGLIHCSSSEMYSGHGAFEVFEHSQLNPTSVYGRHKALAHDYLISMRDKGLLRGSSAILFNHESPRRPKTFVSQKIVSGAKDISIGKIEFLTLGNVLIQRDWGYAKDYANAIRLISASNTLQDFVIASGKLHTILDFVERAFSFYGIKVNDTTLKLDQSLFRNRDNDALFGNPISIHNELGWSPTVNFEELVDLMCASI